MKDNAITGQAYIASPVGTQTSHSIAYRLYKLLSLPPYSQRQFKLQTYRAIFLSKKRIVDLSVEAGIIGDVDVNIFFLTFCLKEWQIFRPC